MLYTVGKNFNWYSFYGKQYGVSSKLKIHLAINKGHRGKQ